MQVTINANGKTVQAEISEGQLKELGLVEQLKKLGLLEDKPRTGYEGREECNNKKHYFVNTIDLVIEDENTVLFDQNRYDVGNYYSDKTIAENNARADRLLRQLRQWQAQNDEPISISDWKNDNIFKYHIEYDCFNDFPFVVYTTRFRSPNTIYFTSGEKAEGAIEVFKDELKWYYTKYQQRLDEE